MPTKTNSGRWDVPWMAQHIKHKIHQKHRMYNNVRRTSKESDWRKFRNMRKHIKDLLKKSHTEYVMGLLDIKLPSEDGQWALFSLGKRFWAYVRSQRRDQVGITRLKEGDMEITNPKECAWVLGQQYDSVFTDENLTYIPAPNTIISRHWQPLHFHPWCLETPDPDVT